MDKKNKKMEKNRQHNKTLNWQGGSGVPTGGGGGAGAQTAPPPDEWQATKKEREREGEGERREKKGIFFLLVSSYFKQNPLRE